MKKYLLLSLAVGSVLNMAAVQPALDNADKTALIGKSAVKSDFSASKMNMPLSLKNSNVKSKYSLVNGVSSVAKAPVSEENQPYYLLPAASLYFGYIPQDDGAGIGYIQYQDGSILSEVFGPAFAEQNWINVSSYAEGTDFTKAFTWNFLDPEANYEVATNNEIDLTTNYGYAEVDCPVLEFDEKDYQAALAARFGGTCYQRLQSETVITPSMPFNPGDEDNDFAYSRYYTINGEEWGQIYGVPEGEALNHLGVGMVMDQPTHPYGLFSVYFCGVVTNYVSERMNVNVYELSVDDDKRYVLGDVIASGYLDKENIPVDQQKYVYFPIPLMVEDGELSYETYVNIDTPVLIVFDGFDTAAGDEVYLGGAYTTDTFQETFGTAVNLVEFRDQKLIMNSALSFQSGEVCGNLAIGLNNVYGFMDPETEATAYEKPEVWNVPAEGGSKTFVYSPLYDLAELGIVEGDGAFEWWEAMAAAYNEDAGTQSVEITVEPLPEGTAGRWTTATISIPGAYRKISIIQGEVAGIDNVTAVEKAELDWNAPVYNVMGQKVSKGFTGIAIQNGNKFIVK